jgi:nitrous oxidase accessory protein
MLRHLLILPALILSLSPVFSPVAAKEINVPGAGDALAEALKTAQAGDILRLADTTYAGPVTIRTPLTIFGNGATINGGGTGSVITVDAPDVTVQDLTVTGSGSGGDGLDAGIKLTKAALGAVIRNNQLHGNLIGIDVHGAKDALIEGNQIEGRQDPRMNARGNGIYVWNAPGTRVIGNDIRYGRDGIFVNTSRNNAFVGNRMRDLRFAIHYMYADNSRIDGNISQGNHLGYAIMNSKRVSILGNLSQGDRDHGIMLNYTNSATIRGNLIREGGDKCLFIYNAHKNQIEGNLFEACDTGVHFTAGSERNAITGNAFINNRTQVRYAGTSWVDWSVDGRGNYWSDHAAFDLDGNGVADSIYRPNDVMDQILWRQPAAKSLLGSPAVQLIRWSQSAFPALLPGGVVDRAPLMTATIPVTPTWEDPK